MYIRDARDDDSAEIAGLSEQLGYPASSQEIRSRLQTLLESDTDAVLVACLGDDTVVGWIHVFVTLRLETGRFAEIGGLVVDRDSRSRGMGAELLSRATKWAEERGISRLRVRSRESRTDALRFYERHGFAQTKRQCVLDKPLKTRG
jgi:ribosomal protein S18 acetylase RimI-like enzyme